MKCKSDLCWTIPKRIRLKFCSNPTCARHCRPRIHGMPYFGERVGRHGGGQGGRHGGKQGGRHGDQHESRRSADKWILLYIQPLRKLCHVRVWFGLSTSCAAIHYRFKNRLCHCLHTKSFNLAQKFSAAMPFFCAA